MNNIIVSQEKEIKLCDFEGNIEINTEALDIYINGNVILNEITKGSDNLKLNIHLSDNSKLHYNRFGILDNYLLNISLNSANNCECTFNYSFMALGNANIKLHNNLKGSQNDSKIVIRGVTDNNGLVNIEATGEVNSSTTLNDLILDIRCLGTSDNTCAIVPSMLVNSDNVTASHFVTIGNISESELFYLHSKGINDKEAKKLIRNGFLINNLNLKSENYIKIKKVLNEGGRLNES